MGWSRRELVTREDIEIMLAALATDLRSDLATAEDSEASLTIKLVDNKAHMIYCSISEGLRKAQTEENLEGINRSSDVNVHCWIKGDMSSPTGRFRSHQSWQAGLDCVSRSTAFICC